VALRIMLLVFLTALGLYSSCLARPSPKSNCDVIAQILVFIVPLANFVLVRQSA
jgi:hypothetical protein